MRISDINPFLRFVNVVNFEPVQRNFRAADCHFYYMLTDSCPICIDGVQYAPGLGTAIIVPAGVDYYFGREGFLQVVSINFDYTQVASYITDFRSPVLAESFDGDTITECPDFEEYPFLNRPIVLENMHLLRPTVEAILEEYTYKKQFYREVSAALFKKLLFDIMRAVLLESGRRDTVDTVLDYIRRHYAEEIDNDVLSQTVGYHPYHLNRLMKAATGTTLRQYLIGYRMEIAKRYLRETDYSVAAVAELCGYKNISNFSADFKRKTGIPPTKYRGELHYMA